ncbi:Legionella secretion system protein X [Legionella londiniensis]|uniref:Octanoyltransferase n=1 Tax=Legionella londiniensis TaxID=45068 RepID=A0A0W0VNR9_9GAMM|nr:Legionella secretion system protein X [Legionella londiniensis]STX93428.1 Legionella secretion system protein X [Legionella londiniensis]
MINIKKLGIQPYELIWNEMKRFTLERDNFTPDELWLLEHYPVYTQGQAGKKEHILNPESIPVVQSDRGGQVTYHGPGQLVAYVLMDIRRKKMGIRTLVCHLEQILMAVLNEFGIFSETRCGAPGVYVQEKKIASIGLRVKNGCAYHGIALNVDMDLKPFAGINPCGYQKLQMTQIKDFFPDIDIDMASSAFTDKFLTVFEP